MTRQSRAAGKPVAQYVRESRDPTVRVMDELQRDVRRAVPAVQQVFIDPTPTRESRAAPVAASAI